MSLVRLTLFDRLWTALTEDKEKSAHTLAYSASRGPNAYITNTERLGLLFCLSELSRFIKQEIAKTLPYYVLKQMLLYFASNFGAKIQLIINKVKRNQEFFIALQAKNIESRIGGIGGIGLAL